jgi:methylenetetrahydrofolate reductase (NADPH)
MGEFVVIAAAIAETSCVPSSDLLEGYSFEISAKDAAKLEGIRPLVPAGTVVSITYLPTETDTARIAAAAEARRLGLTPMPHIAARRIPSLADLHRFLEGLAVEAAVDRLFIVAGDLGTPIGPFADALAVINELRRGEHNLTSVGIAGYPEGHPGIGNEALDRAMRDKIASLTDHGLSVEIMTQFAFDADPVIAWLTALRTAGVDARVRLGLPGPANVGTLLRFAARCGVGASAKVMAKYGASITRLLNTAGPDRLYAELAEGISPAVHGEVAIHLYPFGGLQKMAEWAHGNAPRPVN